MAKVFKFDGGEIRYGAGTAGEAGQVLTSGGPGAGPSWETPSGGGGSSAARSITVHADGGATATWTNMPAASAFLLGSVRHVQRVDLAGATQCRLLMNKQATAGAASAVARACYASAYSTSVGSYADLGATPCQVAINVQNTYLDSGWVDLAAGAVSAGEVFLSILGSGGDGVLDPQFGAIVVMLR